MAADPEHQGWSRSVPPVSAGGDVDDLAWLETLVGPLLADDYLSGLENVPVERIAAMRQACVDAEVVVSFLRRVLQGRLDVVETVLESRAKGQPLSAPELVEQLPAVLTRQAPPSESHRLVGAFAPDIESPHLGAALGAMLEFDQLVALLDADDDQLRHIYESTGVKERQISAQRRALHQRLEALRAEVVERYRTRRISVDERFA